MGNTYTIQKEIRKGKEVYVVYKNGPLNKTFPTLEKAEAYKKKKEEKENGAKKWDFKKIVIASFFWCLFTFIVFVALKAQVNHKFWGVVVSFILQFGLSMFVLCLIIPYSVDKKKIIPSAAIFTNVIFMLAPTMFIVGNTCYGELWFQIVSFVTLYILLLFIYKHIKKEKIIDLSLLRITNYFLIVLATGVFFLMNKYCDNKAIQENNKDILEKIKAIQEIFHFYYLIPLLMLQGLYRLLDKIGNSNTITEVYSSEK